MMISNCKNSLVFVVSTKLFQRCNGVDLEVCIIIFTHLKLWITSARHNFKWVKIVMISAYLPWNLDMVDKSRNKSLHAH